MITAGSVDSHLASLASLRAAAAMFGYLLSEAIFGRPESPLRVGLVQVAHDARPSLADRRSGTQLAICGA